jgi:hypothetical protein
MLALLPALVLVGLQEAQPAALYPQLRSEVVMRFFSIKGDVDQAALDTALSEARIEIVQGPQACESRPGRVFVAVHVPTEASVRDVMRVLGKGGGKAEELACVVFDGRTQADTELPSFGLGLTTRDFILGMSGEIRWYDSLEGRSQFYGPAGKLEPSDIQKRYQKLYEPFGGGTIGTLVRERFTWTLARALEERDAQKLVKQIEKLALVVSATLEGAALTVEVELSDLLVSNPRLPSPLPEPPEGEQVAPALRQQADALPRATWCTGPLFDLLAAEGLATAGG